MMGVVAQWLPNALEQHALVRHEKLHFFFFLISLCNYKYLCLGSAPILTKSSAVVGRKEVFMEQVHQFHKIISRVIKIC